MNQQLAIDTLRVFSMDAIDRANSGHPGLPLGAAPMAWTLWANQMNHYSKDPKWLNRDRFVLSAGHGSALLYSLLYVFQYGLEAKDLENFRQLDSKTPGHPEYGHTVGVETTTGPLGAGITAAVGMAMAEARLGAIYNQADLEIIDHYTYVLCGDGDLMEGVSNEASSLAGTLGLDKLIVLYDSNNITIEGRTDLAFTENVLARYEALGWQAIYVEDGNDIEAINSAIEEAKKDKRRPSIIEVKTKIGFASPVEDSSAAHGSPLGEEKSKETREKLGYPDYKSFEIPSEVSEFVEKVTKENEEKYHAWNELLKTYEEQYPELYKKLMEHIDASKQDLSFMDEDAYWESFGEDLATRAASGKALQRVAEGAGNLFGGSADLSPSNNSVMDNTTSFARDNYIGGNIHFGVREHAMAGIINGIQLHGGFRAYGATFLVFSDYLKPQIRLSALMQLPVTYIFTHDSIGVGEDGPTHQPIEQLSMLRATPNLIVYRPADGTEALAGWYIAMHSTRTPVALSLTRQKLPELENSSKDALKGGYIIGKEENELEYILMASGSEVHLALEAKKTLEKEGHGTRVVSMPSMELFEAQCKEYRNKILPPDVTKRLAIEAGATQSWYKYVGLDGLVMGIDEFGASAPGAEVFDYFCINTKSILKHVKEL